MVSVIITSPVEIAMSAIDTMREHAKEIQRLADVEATPLAPEETIDSRRHKIASLGLKMANAFGAIDAIVRMTIADAAHERTEGVKVERVRPEDPNAN